MAQATIDINVNAQPVKNLRQELRAAITEAQALASAEIVDQAALEAAVLKTAELKDRVADVNEQISVFASGSKYEVVNNSLGQIGSAIKNLDFGKAQERAGAFAKAAKNISFKDAMGSLKQLGSTFATLGRALLTNPYFLLGAVILLIVVAVYKFLDSLGLIEKMLAILMAPLNVLIDGLKSLGDFFGLTSFAAEEAAEKKSASYDKMADNVKRANDKVIASTEQEIRMAKLAGEDTNELVLKKLALIKETAIAEDMAAQLKLTQARRNRRLNKQEIKELEAAAAQTKAIAQKASDDITYQIAVNKKAIDDAILKENADTKAAEDKTEADNAKKAVQAKSAAAKKLADEKAFQAARLKASRDIVDLEISFIADDTQRAIAENKVKYERIIADTIANEKLLQTEKDKLKLLFEEQSKAQEDAIKEEAKKIKKEEEIQAQQELSELMLSLNQNTFEQQKIEAENQQKEKLDILKKQLEQGLITQQQFDAASIALEAEKQRKLEELKGGASGMSVIEKAKMEADALRLIEQQRLDAEIIDYEQYAARIAQIDKDLNDKIKEEDKKTKDSKIAILNEGIDAAANAISSIGNLSSIRNQTEINNAEGNEEKQEELRKKGFEQNKKFQIAQAGISGIQGVINALTAQSTIPEPFGTILKGFNAVMVAGTTKANIAKIKSATYQGGSPSPDTASAGGGSSASRALPSVSFQGGMGGGQNNVSAGGGQPMEITLQNNVSVSATEVQKVQQTNAMLQNNAQI